MAEIGLDSDVLTVEQVERCKGTDSVLSCTLSPQETILKKGLVIYTDITDNNTNHN